jgi:hypothetical protein
MLGEAAFVAMDIATIAACVIIFAINLTLSKIDVV